MAYRERDSEELWFSQPDCHWYGLVPKANTLATVKFRIPNGRDIYAEMSDPHRGLRHESSGNVAVWMSDLSRKRLQASLRSAEAAQFQQPYIRPIHQRYRSTVIILAVSVAVNNQPLMTNTSHEELQNAFMPDNVSYTFIFANPIVYV